MAAKAKFVRGKWGVYYDQYGTRWYAAMADGKTAKDVAKRANERMTKGEDLRPEDKRPITAERPSPPTRAPAGVPFQAFSTQWLVDEQATRKNTTNAYYEWALRVHLNPVIGEVDIRTFDRELVKKTLMTFIGKKSKRTKQPLSNPTIEGIHATLSAVLSAAVDQNHLIGNPAIDLPEKYMADPNEIVEEIECWTAEQAERFLEVCLEKFPSWHPFFMLAIRNGPRLGELTEFRWDKDFKKPHKLQVQRSYSARTRKRIVIDADGSHRSETVESDRISSTKGKRTRYLDLTPDVEAVLDKHRAAERERCFKAGKPFSLVFTGSRFARVDGANLEERVMKKVIAIAKLPPLSIHGLRHVYATVTLQTEPLRYVSEQLGHADISTTERIYRHHLPATEGEEERRTRRDAAWKVKTAAGAKVRKGRNDDPQTNPQTIRKHAPSTDDGELL